MSDSPAVAAVLLNWNGWRDTIGCLETLAAVDYADLDLYVVDNGSTDDSVDRILAWARSRAWSPEVVQAASEGGQGKLVAHRGALRLFVIRNEDNSGFARGTNIGMRHALASGRPYLALWALNTDTLVEPGAVAAAVSALLAEPQVGSVQSVLLGYPNDRLLDSAGVRLLRRGGARDLLRGRPVDAIPPVNAGAGVPIFGSCAASAFYRAAALHEVGLFDEELFQTNEDVDLACRLYAAGYSALLAPDSVVRHKGGVSRHRQRGRSWLMAHRAKLLVVARWWPRSLALAALTIGVLRSFIVTLRTRGVGVHEWLGLLPALWGRYRGGADARVRWRVLRCGVRGFL